LVWSSRNYRTGSQHSIRTYVTTSPRTIWTICHGAGRRQDSVKSHGRH